MGKKRLMGDVAEDLRVAASVARRSIISAGGLDALHARDEAVSELAHAVVLLARVAARCDLCCGMPDPADEDPDHA